jgi:hypothetical protein
VPKLKTFDAKRSSNLTFDVKRSYNSSKCHDQQQEMQEVRNSCKIQHRQKKKLLEENGIFKRKYVYDKVLICLI